jgi:hypothetical protein
MLGWATVDRAGKIARRHRAANNQQAAHSADNVADARPICRENELSPSISEGEGEGEGEGGHCLARPTTDVQSPTADWHQHESIFHRHPPI